MTAPQQAQSEEAFEQWAQQWEDRTLTGEIFTLSSDGIAHLILQIPPLGPLGPTGLLGLLGPAENRLTSSPRRAPRGRPQVVPLGDRRRRAQRMTILQ